MYMMVYKTHLSPQILVNKFVINAQEVIYFELCQITNE